MNDPKYPIYHIKASWVQDGLTINDSRTEGLPDGKFWNATSFRHMFKEEKSQRELNGFALDWWLRYVKEKFNDVPIQLFSLSVTYLEHETWNLTWFAHETFDVGQSDEEALSSFAAFVARKEHFNFDKEINEQYPLMGADDRWRRAINDGPAPCRCDDCKKLGMIRINH